MKENVFSVDLGDLKLTQEQRNRINAAIHSAVVKEVALLGLKEQLVYIPSCVGKGHGHHVNGMIIRPMDKKHPPSVNG